MKRKDVLCLLILLCFSPFIPGKAMNDPGDASPLSYAAPYDCEEDLIEVMFAWDSRVRMRSGVITDLATNALDGIPHLLSGLDWHEWQPFSGVPEETIDQWEITGEQRSGDDLYNLNNIYRLKIPAGHDVWKLSRDLEALPGIFRARPVPKPVIPPLPGNYQSQQGYLNPATNNPSGIDALYAWTKTGGTGTGVTICDLEYSWNYSHADISKAAGSQINPNPYSDPFSSTNHGTAVIGVLVADNNGWGITGICYSAGLKTCATYYNSAWNVPGAISYAIAALSAGDIILLEQQWPYTAGGTDYIPVEWWTDYAPGGQSYNACYAAIVTAVANGIHVVQAGGNGNVNTGNLTWYGNSGAIIVGAGGASSSNDRTRLYFSSYGPRFDLQGWGENVVTTGYGDLYSSQGINYYYTSIFNGTSSASPVVAGALACAEGYYMANVSSTPPTPAFMRSQLALHGTAQVTPPSGNIGPRPNVKAFIIANPPPVQTLDFGDAPDPPYPTLLASSGARHYISNLKLGMIIDSENDGQPNINATGDDLNPLTADDEDGVTFTSALIPGQMASVQVVSSGTGMLNAWIDFNKINVWSDPGEFIFQNIPVSAGVNNLNFMVPATAIPGSTYARFRLTSQGGVLFYGLAPDGEVEDYEVFIEENSDPDWGDAPDPTYPTLSTNNGAYHMIDGITFLGLLIDPEPDGQPEPLAMGDDYDILYPPISDDEDGVTFSGPMIANQPFGMVVTASVMGFLNVWIDFNKNGSWADPGDHVFIDYTLSPGSNVLTILVPPYVQPGLTFARFRFCTMQGLSYMGGAPNGEVEDYSIMIESEMEYDWGDAPDPLYPTLSANNGACHRIDGITYLGMLIDPEPDGQPEPIAMGDDLDILYPPVSDDEDGVTFSGPMIPNQNFVMNVTASVQGFLNVWIDFDQNGSWADPGEHVFIDNFLIPGINSLTIIVPSYAIPGTTFARFRFCTLQGLTFMGLAANGEVEDYSIMVEPELYYDWGDAPDPTYPTSIVSSGAHHSLDGYTYLGLQIDPEPGGQPHPHAMGDDIAGMDDEDGVKLINSLHPGQLSTLDIRANSPCLLNAWFDFNRNGSWGDPGEHLFVNMPLVAGSNPINFMVPPAMTAGELFARFRVNQNGGISYTGYGYGGEVEDYKFIVFDTIPNIKSGNPQYPDPTGWDVNMTHPAKLGDDWICSESGPVTDIHFWISWPQDIIPANLDTILQYFEVSIFSDMPAAISPTGYSMPDTLLWSRNFAPGEFICTEAFLHLQGWYDPYSGIYNPFDHERCFRVDIDVPDDPFVQEYGHIYWLVISAHMNNAGGHTQDIVVTLDNVNPNILPYQVWNEAGVNLSLQNHPTSGTCSFGIDPDGIWLYPAMLNLDLTGLPGRVVSAEVDIIDYCGVGCTVATLWEAGVTLSQDANTMSGVMETLVLTNPGAGFPDQLTVTSFEGKVFEIRLVIEMGENFYVGWKSATDHWNDNAVYQNHTGLINWFELYDPISQEDLHLSFVITGGAYLDYGDAPEPTFPTTLVADGARHVMDTITYLGFLIDAEVDGQPSGNATADDLNNAADEDGVQLLWPLAKGNPCKIRVRASVGDAMFNAWFDFNGNGSWADTNEHVFSDINLLTGDNYLTFIVPQDAVPGSCFARFRFSHQPALSYTGFAFDGEVEDYLYQLIEYGELKWSQPPDKNNPGLHATDMALLADDWKCNGEVVTDIHWWGNYEMRASGGEKRGSGINHFVLTIYNDSLCLPNQALVSYSVPFTPALEIYAGIVNNEGSPIYKYNFLLPDPFIQVEDSLYWLSVQAISNDISDPPSWRWQEANRWLFPILCGAADNYTGFWQTITWPFPPLIKYSDMAFEISSWVIDTLYLQDITVTNGQNLCYDANYVIMIAGGGTTFTVDSGSSATMIAGQRILYLPGTHAKLGSYMHGYITTTGQFCPRAPVMTGITDPEPAPEANGVRVANWKAYPNPTNGILTIEPTSGVVKGNMVIETYSLMGEKLFIFQYPPQGRYVISMDDFPSGIYIIRIIHETGSATFKVIKQ